MSKPGSSQSIFQKVALMKRNFTLLPILALGLTALLASSVELSAPLSIRSAHAVPSFNSAELEGGIKEFYDLYGSNGTDGTEGPLTEIDKLEYADSISELVSYLDPTPFNDVVGHMAADYGTNPTHRGAIEAIVSRLHAAVLPQLRAQSEQSALTTVVDDVFKAWTVAYAFGFGKGVWKSRGSGLQGLERFKYVVTSISANLPKSTREHLIAAGVGGAVGVAHAVYLHLQTKKLDPARVLLDAQAGVAQNLGVKTAQARASLTRYSRMQQIPSAEQATVRTLIQTLDPELRETQDELTHLYDAAPPLRPQLSPIADDLRAARGLVGRIGLKLDGNELSNEFGALP